MAPFGSRRDRICAVAAAPTAAEMRHQVLSGLRETRTIELRLDWLRSDAERTKILKWLKYQNHPRGNFIATCRRVEGGGRLRGKVDAELYWLTQARDAGCLWCDLEIETLRRLPGMSVHGLPVPPRVLLSEHDFERTPRLPNRLPAA